MPKGICHQYTNEQLIFLEKNKTVERQKLTTLFNQKFTTGLSKIAINALCKRKGWLTGRTGYFNKSNKPWNTGTKGLCYGSSTSYAKGHVPANSTPLGHERICAKDGIILIKINEPNPYTNANTRYKAKHLVLWEKNHGPIDKGMVVRFINNDKKDCNLANLEIVNKAVHLRMNQMDYSNLDDEIKPTAKAHVQLEVATFLTMKKIANE